MILRKPYAFLIKYFRIIHLLLLLPIGYLISKTLKIVSFFKDYVNNNYSTNIVNIAGEHINFLMYFAVLIVIGVVIAIYYLMRQKRKSTRLYFFTIIYYIFLFMLIGVTHSILSNMEINLISAQTARAYRDVAWVLILPEYFFFAYTLIRGIGFDVKKFDFANDLKDMEITDIDNEEFEFEFNIEGYKAKRTLRRLVRETRYYILENLFVFGCIAAVFVVFIGTTLYLHFGVYNRTYHITDRMVHNYFNIQATDSIITNLGLDGNIIQNGKYFLAMQLLIENRSNKNYKLDYNDFRLVLNEKDFYPVLDRGEYFIDLGIPYNNEDINKGTKAYYVLVYEIDEKDLTGDYIIKILESASYKKGEIQAKYKNIKLSPKRIDSTNEEVLTLDKTANFKNSSLGYSTLKVNTFQFSNSYSYTYDYCYSENNCTTLKDKITTNLSGSIEKTTLFVLNLDYSIDENSMYRSNIKSENKIFDKLFSLRYVIDGKTYTISLKNKTPENLKEAFVFETKQEVAKAEKIDLIVSVRNNRYVFNLK